jgi:hypothetical protein
MWCVSFNVEHDFLKSSIYEALVLQIVDTFRDTYSWTILSNRYVEHPLYEAECHTFGMQPYRRKVVFK